MNKQTGQKGFTIVELLIVIVIIAVLAAITIIAYNGIIARANSTSAKTAANVVIKKMEAYNVDVGGYPNRSRLLTTAASTEIYNLTNVTFKDDATEAAAKSTTAPAKSNVLIYYSCTTGAGVMYWDYTSSASNKWTAIATGGAASDLATGCTYKRESLTS